MITLKESREMLLRQLENRVNSYIQKDSKDPESIDLYMKTLRKLMEIYFLIAILPVSNRIFEWYRWNIENVNIHVNEDRVKIFKKEGQDMEYIEFTEGDIFNLIYKAFEARN